MAKSEYKKIRKLIKPYRVTNGNKFRLKDVDPDDTGGLKSEVKGKAKELLARGVELLADEQARLYAQDRWSVLLIFQAMDALAELDLHYPKVGAEQRRALAAARRELTRG